MLTLLAALMLTPAPAAQAQTGAYLVSGPDHLWGNLYRIEVYSPANDEVIANDILLPDGDQARPTLYLLPGYFGGTDGLTWANTTNYEEFFADKNVNVVSPIGGAGSYYSDWYFTDPIRGTLKWETYLTRELPEVIDRHFHGTGTDAVAGLSMSGGPALGVATRNPDRFRAAASYSGCPMSSGLLGAPLATALMLGTGANISNAWGPVWDEAWYSHDPSFDPARLRNTAVFVGSSSGTPGPIDGFYTPGLWGGPMIVEAGANACSDYFTWRAQEAGVAVDRYWRQDGAHTWGLFEDELRTSWRTIGPAIGA